LLTHLSVVHAVLGAVGRVAIQPFAGGVFAKTTDAAGA
jgi:hypothetical protein